MYQLPKQSQFVVITHDLNAAGAQWIENINVNTLKPTHVKVHSISYKNDGTENFLSIIQSEFLRRHCGTDILGTIMDGAISSNGQIYKLNGDPVRGSYEFTILDVNRTISGFVGDLVIILEFMDLSE